MFLFLSVWSLASSLQKDNTNWLPTKFKFILMRFFWNIYVFSFFIFSNTAAKYCRCGTNTIDWHRNLSVPLYGYMWKFVQFGMYFSVLWNSKQFKWMHFTERVENKMVSSSRRDTFTTRNESENIYSKVVLTLFKTKKKENPLSVLTQQTEDYWRIGAFSIEQKQ